MMRPGGQEPRRHDLITWSEVDELIDGLVPQINTMGSFVAMVMITRGGVIPGGLLAEALDIQHMLTAAVDFPSTEASGMMAWPTFLQFPDSGLIRGRKILIIDDVWGSGRTSIAVRERVSSAGGTPFNCVLHFNPYRSLFSNIKPDFYGDVTDAYIVYPWEVDRGLRGMGFGEGQPEI